MTPRAEPIAIPRVDAQRPASSLAAKPSERRCRICDTQNAAGLRYCTSCGSTLEPAAGAAPPAPVQPIMTVGADAAPAAERDAASNRDTRSCHRCNAVVEAAAQFCKFCGSSLPAPFGAAAKRPLEPPHINGASLNGNGRASKAPPALATGPNDTERPPAGAPTPSTAPIGPAAVPSTGAAALAAIPLRENVHSRPTAPAAVAAPAPQRGRLVLIAKSGADGPSYPFNDLLDIGRVEGNVIVAEDPYLSPRHVRIVWSAGKLTLRDLGSTNGVYLRLSPARGGRTAEGEIATPLVDQDLILIGQQVLRFEILRDTEGGFGPAQEHGTLLFGSPAAPRYARLCQRTVEGITRDVYYVRKVETVLGRESGDVVFTEDPFLSRRHAAIRLLGRDGAMAVGTPSRPPPPAAGGARFSLVDLGSSNGTFVRIRGDVELLPGDHFRVGQQLFRVDVDGTREPAMRSSS